MPKFLLLFVLLFSMVSCVSEEESSYLSEIEYLIERGADIDAANENGYTPLMVASQNGYVKVVKLLIDVGANPDRRGFIFTHSGPAEDLNASVSRWDNPKRAQGNTISSATGNIHILLDDTKKTQSNTTQRYTHMTLFDNVMRVQDEMIDTQPPTALVLASLGGHTKITKLLIDAGANLNASNKVGYTALMHASQNGHVKIVELLVNAGANVNTRDFFGITALKKASGENRVKIVKLLIDAGAHRE